MEEKLKAGVPIPKIYFSLALPSVLNMVLSIFYNMADTYFIAQTQNVDLVAGVSLCAPVFTLLMAFGNIFGQGGCSLISRLMGQHEQTGVRRVSAFCFYASLFTGIVTGAAMLLFTAPLLRLLGADMASAPFASSYFQWLALGAPFIVASFVFTNLLRAVGLSIQSMIASMSGTVVNVILDPILISVFGMGAAGAAIATVMGYICTNVLCLFYVWKQCPCFSVRLRDAGVDGQYAGQIFGIGVPAALTNVMQSLSVILVNQALLPYGNDKIAAMGIVLKVSMVAVLLIVGFSFGGQPLVGYLYGLGDKPKLHQLIRFCFAFLGGLAGILTVVLLIGARPLTGLFLKDAAVVQTGADMFRWQNITLVLVAVGQLIMIFFQATGKALPAFFLSISRQGVLFILVLTAAQALAGYNGIIAAQAAADVLNAILAVSLYAFGLRRELEE